MGVRSLTCEMKAREAVAELDKLLPWAPSDVRDRLRRLVYDECLDSANPDYFHVRFEVVECRDACEVVLHSNPATGFEVIRGKVETVECRDVSKTLKICRFLIKPPAVYVEIFKCEGIYVYILTKAED